MIIRCSAPHGTLYTAESPVPVTLRAQVEAALRYAIGAGHVIRIVPETNRVLFNTCLPHPRGGPVHQPRSLWGYLDRETGWIFSSATGNDTLLRITFPLDRSTR